MCIQISNPSYRQWTEQLLPVAQPSESTISVTMSPTRLTLEMNGLMQLSDEQIFSMVRPVIQAARENWRRLGKNIGEGSECK